VVAIFISTTIAAGCGGGDGTGAKGDVDLTSAEAIARALDAGGYECINFERNTEVVGAREDGSCEHGEDSISITTYNSADQKRSIEKAFSALATGVPVGGDKWTVSAPTKSDAEQIQKILGGKVG
jgi:hypothetical protein